MCTKGLIYTATFVHMAVFRAYVWFLASGTGSLQKAPWSLNQQKIEVSYNVGISSKCSSIFAISIVEFKCYLNILRY